MTTIKGQESVTGRTLSVAKRKELGSRLRSPLRSSETKNVIVDIGRTGWRIRAQMGRAGPLQRRGWVDGELREGLWIDCRIGVGGVCGLAFCVDTRP